MTDDRGPSVGVGATPLAGSEDNLSDLREQQTDRSQFTWTPRDRQDAASIAAALLQGGRGEHAVAIMEASVELALHAENDPSARKPREADAWRFFLAARELPPSCSSLAARARQHGARIAFALSGIMFVDAKLFQFGTSQRIIFYDEHGHGYTAVAGADK